MTFNKKLTFISVLFAATAITVAIGAFKQSLYRLTSDFQHPFTLPISSAETMASRESLALKSKSDLIDEVLKLRKTNERLSANLALVKDLTREKEALEKLVQLPPRPDFTPVFARIVVRDPVFWNIRFSIDKGSASGITVGDVALARSVKPFHENGVEVEFAVVGRIISVSSHRACVETIASRACRISVVVADNRAPGVTEGTSLKNGEPMIRLAYLPAFKKYKAGTPVLTSGFVTLGTENLPAIPSGLLIGTLAPKPGGGSVATVVDNLTAEAKVLPAIDLDSLTQIAVMTRQLPTDRESERHATDIHPSQFP